MTAIAPALCALKAFVWNVQVPRSTSAILPATAAAFVNAVHPSVVAGPEPFAIVLAGTTVPVTPVLLMGVPKAGGSELERAGNGRRARGFATRGCRMTSTDGTPASTLVPSQTTLPNLVADCWRWASVIWSQNKLFVESNV